MTFSECIRHLFPWKQPKYTQCYCCICIIYTDFPIYRMAGHEFHQISAQLRGCVSICRLSAGLFKASHSGNLTYVFLMGEIRSGNMWCFWTHKLRPPHIPLVIASQALNQWSRAVYSSTESEVGVNICWIIT